MRKSGHQGSSEGNSGCSTSRVNDVRIKKEVIEEEEEEDEFNNFHENRVNSSLGSVGPNASGSFSHHNINHTNHYSSRINLKRSISSISPSSYSTFNQSDVKRGIKKGRGMVSLQDMCSGYPLDSSPPLDSSSPLTPTDCLQQDMFCSSTISGDGSSNTSMDAGDSKISTVGSDHSSPKRLCLVCGDVASGFHYGVASCEACKAFFKRTIQGNIEYQCPASNDCEINKRRRKACQACRFQKCLRMGMLKEGVRLDRVRGGRQKYRRTSESLGPQTGGHQSTSNSQQPKRSSLEDNKVVNALLNSEPEPLVLSASGSQGHMGSSSSSPSSSSSTSALNIINNLNQTKGICTLSDLVDRELVATISWAKHIPGFTDLILNDQMRLLQSTWGEILALTLAYRSQQLIGSCSLSSIINSQSVPQKLMFASDFIMDENLAIHCKAEEMFHLFMQLIKRLASIRMAKEEYLVMKALLLTNVDIDLEDCSSVTKLRETLLCSLDDCVSSIRSSLNSSLHVSQMLLCLPLLRQTDGAIRRFWINVRRDGKVPMNKLFVEMLESNIALR